MEGKVSNRKRSHDVMWAPRDAGAMVSSVLSSAISQRTVLGWCPAANLK